MSLRFLSRDSCPGRSPSPLLRIKIEREIYQSLKKYLNPLHRQLKNAEAAVILLTRAHCYATLYLLNYYLLNNQITSSRFL